MRKFVAVCLLTTTMSCYGSFELFHKIHKWNGTLGDKWVNTLVHVALWILPMYEFILLGDFLLFNSIEFWSGNNPLKVSAADITVDDNAARLTLDGRVHELRVVDERSFDIAVDGLVVGRAHREAYGDWLLEDYRSGKVIHVKRAVNSEEWPSG